MQEQNNKKVFVGVDPGSDGFLSISYGDELIFQPVPKIKDKVDHHELARIISTINDSGITHCVLEDIHAVFGSSAGSTFNFGHIQGFIEGCLCTHGIPYTKVQPKAWQKVMWEGIPLITKPSTTGKTHVTDTKAMSLMAAKRLFPKVDLRASERCKIPHDGKVDSLLIMQYCKYKFK